jgi:hypothetical protein
VSVSVDSYEGADKSLALLKKISYRIEKMYLLYIFPLSSTYL